MVQLISSIFYCVSIQLCFDILSKNELLAIHFFQINLLNNGQNYRNACYS